MSKKIDFHKKFKYSVLNNSFLDFYIENGYVVFRDVFDPKTKKYFYQTVMSLFNKLSSEKKIIDYQNISIKIMDIIENREKKLYENFLYNEKLLGILKNFLGTDICLFNNTALWINEPNNKNPVLNKSPHTDAWTGTGINTIFMKYWFTNIDKYNGVTVYPGTHLQGMLPVKNRTLDDIHELDFYSVNLYKIKMGDILIWHPLLLHKTTGHSKKNMRISMTLRYTSTDTEFTSQEKSLGYRMISVGPHNTINRIIGNDYLTPLRTYGGFSGIDKRLKKIYKHGNYR